VSVYVTDTHPLVWYATGTHRQLSSKVLRVFQAASGAEALIYVPVFVLWETAMLLKVGRIALHEPYGHWAEHLLTQPGFALAAVDVRMLHEAYYYPFPDPFDSVITATARVMDVPLMTNDAEIHASQLTEVYW
jgi:PIN domain nuclease of toxin-antitoxin system